MSEKPEGGDGGWQKGWFPKQRIVEMLLAVGAMAGLLEVRVAHLESQFEVLQSSSTHFAQRLEKTARSEHIDRLLERIDGSRAAAEANARELLRQAGRIDRLSDHTALSGHPGMTERQAATELRIGTAEDRVKNIAARVLDLTERVREIERHLIERDEHAENGATAATLSTDGRRL